MNNTNLIMLFVIVLLISACAQGPRKIETVFYPPPPQTPRVQFLTSITTEEDVGGKNQFRAFLVGEEETGKSLARPYAIAHEEGRLYIADKTIRKILIVDFKEGSFDYIQDIKGGALEDPSGIAVTSDGYKYVADASRRQIVVYNDRNEFSRAYGAEGQFRPTDVIVRDNRIYVCDIDGGEIEVLDKTTGEVLNIIGGPGSAEGSFHSPTHLAMDVLGNLFVTDALNFRVQMFDSDGKFVKVIGYQGSHPGSFARPKGIDVDHDGHLYSADAAFEIIQIFDVESAEPLLPFGKFGQAPGSTYLPSGVHIDYDNVHYFQKYVDRDFRISYLIYVSNMLGEHKLNIYGFGDWVGPSLKGYSAPAQAEAATESSAIPDLEGVEMQDSRTGEQAE